MHIHLVYEHRFQALLGLCQKLVVLCAQSQLPVPEIVYEVLVLAQIVKNQFEIRYRAGYTCKPFFYLPFKRLFLLDGQLVELLVHRRYFHLVIDFYDLISRLAKPKHKTEQGPTALAGKGCEVYVVRTDAARRHMKKLSFHNNRGSFWWISQRSFFDFRCTVKFRNCTAQLNHRLSLYHFNIKNPIAIKTMPISMAVLS